MMSGTNGKHPSLTVAGKESDTPAGEGESWLCEEGPKELASEDDDFEGNRNWAVILIFLALTIFPLIGLIMLLF